MLEDDLLECRELYDLVKHLPPDSALWREQGFKGFTELFHEWAITFLQWQAGKKVQIPSLMEGDLDAHRPHGASEIQATLNELFSGPEPGQSGIVVQAE